MSEYQLQIERLVDGELPFDEEVKLLEACDEHPAGWKQLALAFLEDRAIDASLSTLSNQSSNSDVLQGSVSETVRARAGGFRRTKATRLALACALLLAAFLSGRYSVIAGRDAKPDRMIADSNPASSSDSAESSIEEAQDELPPPIEFVSLDVGDEEGEIQTVDVPLLSWEQVAGSVEPEQEIGGPPSLVSEELKAILARRGQTVRERTDYYPFELSDGRVGVIPVSSVEIQANGLPAIQ